MQNPIDTAAEVIGSQQALAVALGVTKAAVWQWKKQVPVIYCLRIERLTAGKVSRKDLRPNDWHLIWPDLTEPAAA